jgi:prepilin-type N-terminal cleavage/methylation domain-containing protein
MALPRLSDNRQGFTLVELLIGLLIAGFTAAGATYTVGVLHKQSDNRVIQSEMQRLNEAATAYVASGGTIGGGDTALTVLAKIQTPVDTTTFHALGTMTGYLPATYDLQAYSASDGYARLVWSGTAFSVANSGAGYRPVHLATAKTLTPQNIATSGATFATTSPWIWQYGPGGTGSNNKAGLSISGPQTITTPGSYTWTLSGTQSGPLTLTLNSGQIFSGTGTTLSQSEAFNYGDNLSFVIIGTFNPTDKTASSTTTLRVTVAIPTTALSVTYAREDSSSSTNFTYTQVSNPSGPPATRDGIALSVSGSPSGVNIYYTYDGSAPTSSSNLYAGPFQIPLSAWSSSVSFKAVAISNQGSMVSGPILSLTLTPVKAALAAPTLSPASGSTILESSSVTVVPVNGTTDSPRTEKGGVTPTIVSSRALSFTFP